jgi:hypothetical protein
VILPWFGGSAAVWRTCLLFFQASLPAGYLYAHRSARYLKPRRQAMLHVVLMAAGKRDQKALSASGYENRVRRHNSVPLTPRDTSVANTKMIIQGVLTEMGWRAAP